MSTPAATRQVVLSYVLLASILAAIWLGVLQPAWEGYQVRTADIEAAQLRLQRLQHAVDSDPALDPEASGATIEALQQYIGRSSLTARTADIGGSLLRRQLLELVLERGGRPGDTRISDGPGPSMITVSMNVVIGLSGLRDVLYELQSATPYVFVDVLSIRHPGRIGARGDGSNEDLAVQINVSSYWAEAPEKGDGA